MFFIVIVFGIAGLQLIIGNLGGRAFEVSSNVKFLKSSFS
jgi:hypothetical protein